MNDGLTADGKIQPIRLYGWHGETVPNKAPSNDLSVGILPTLTKKVPPHSGRTKTSGSEALEISPAGNWPEEQRKLVHTQLLVALALVRRQLVRSIHGHARNSSRVRRPISLPWLLHFPKRCKQPYENQNHSKFARSLSGLDCHRSARPINHAGGHSGQPDSRGTGASIDALGPTANPRRNLLGH